DVRTLQYYLNVIAYFNPSLSIIPINGIFDSTTAQAVREFQTFYGLEPTGQVALTTWDMLDRIYTETVASLGENYTGGRAKLYPGYFLSEGMEGQNVTDLQSYLSGIADINTAIPKIPVTGYFGSATRNAVETFQRLFGLPVNGAVGPITWNTIAREYDNLMGFTE
ncbi:MAG: peptidoglycan-binding protein, partial [Clostridia bacterium]|nr:peptidoglycan-binding protein [Clostridia bacterium]